MIMAMLEYIRAFSPGVLLQGAKSNVLNSLAWMAASLIFAILGSSLVHSPDWIVTMFAYAFGGDVVLFLIAFVYFGLTDKDALRSERFGIQKMAIERGMIGDSTSGLFLPEDPQQSVQPSSATAPPLKQIEQHK
jgi:hypothetical protein